LAASVNFSGKASVSATASNGEESEKPLLNYLTTTW